MRGFRPQKMTRRHFLTGSLAALGGTFLADTLWYEPQALAVEHLAIKAGDAARGLRLVQISDLHLKRFSTFHHRIAATIDSLKPDVILLTGDYLEEQRNIRGVLDFLRSLRAPQGIYAVQGNWEYWSRLEGDNLRRHFAGVGVRLLINERADIDSDGRSISILGLDYPSSADQLHTLQSQLAPDRFNIMLSHVPAFAHEALHDSVNLVLCGHTHGGQVRLPKLPPLYLPLYTGRFVEGHYKVGPHHTPLYVNRGLGTSVLPMRFLCRPEITSIELS